MFEFFGATREYIEPLFENIPEIRRRNIERIVRLAVERARPAPADAIVPPSLIGCLLGSASYCEDDIAAAYWAGILASSRTAHPRDDRGLRQARQLEKLSLNQIHTHCLFYSALRTVCLHHPGGAKFDLDSRRYLLATFIPVGSFAQAMAFAPEEMPGLGALATDILAGLSAANLLDGSNTGSEQYLNTYFKSAAIVGEGIVFAPSLAGIELYLWACGEGARPLPRFLQPDLRPIVDAGPVAAPGAALVYEQGQNNPSLHN